MHVTALHGLAAEKRRVFFGIFVTGVLAGFAWLVLRPHEPLYQGKPLSLWFQQAYPNGIYDLTLPSPEAAQAVSTVGADAVPLLLRMIAAGDSIGRRILVNVAQEYPFLHLPAQQSEGEVAVWGFKTLGPKGKTAWPALVRLLDERDPVVRFYAARALGALGPSAQEAVPALIAALRRSSGQGWQGTALRDAAAGALGEIGTAALPAVPHLAALTNVLSAELALIKLKGDSFVPFIERLKDTSNPGQWTRAARLLADLGTNAEPAVPFLVSELNSTNSSIRLQSLYAIARIHRRPDLCIPALTALLDSSDSNARYQALLALAAFGREAKPAVPSIIRLIDDAGQRQWLWVQSEATNTLRVIDPEAAAKVISRPGQ